MAKKTKQEKIRAAQRRQQPVTQIETNSNYDISTKISAKTEHPRLNSNTEEKIIRNYFLADFRKSILLITTILLVEMILYQASIHGYLTLFSAH